MSRPPRPALARVLYARVDAELVDDLDRVCADHGIIKNFAITQAVRNWIDEHDDDYARVGLATGSRP